MSIFTLEIRVADSDIAQGHVNNVAFLRYVQDAAIAHWNALAEQEMRSIYTWVVRRHEIEYFKFGLPGDELTARTWVGEATGATWERFTEIVRKSNGEMLVKARTIWVLLDAVSGRPRRVDPRLLPVFIKTSDSPIPASGLDIRSN